jgi:hypothetical protein
MAAAGRSIRCAAGSERNVMGDGPDFIALCRPGLVLRTRDRSEATITRVDAAAGLVHGEVRMFGPCAWRRDGVYKDAPFGAAGPLDLMPPDSAPDAPRRRISMTEALATADRTFCCD